MSKISIRNLGAEAFELYARQYQSRKSLGLAVLGAVGRNLALLRDRDGTDIARRVRESSRKRVKRINSGAAYQGLILFGPPLPEKKEDPNHERDTSVRRRVLAASTNTPLLPALKPLFG